MGVSVGNFIQSHVMGHFETGQGHGDASHYDHEAILGSHKEASEFEQMSPTEAKAKLKILAAKMDRNEDGAVNKDELKQWILRSFRSLSLEESDEQFAESDLNEDGLVSWQEYKANEMDLSIDDALVAQDTSDLDEEYDYLKEDEILFKAADKNKDGRLDKTEFLSFSHPQEDIQMHETVFQHILTEKDLNGNGVIDFQEYIGDRGRDQSKEWLVDEKARFDEDLDLNGDGHMDKAEALAWLIPNEEQLAQDEVNHLFAGADDDVDGNLSMDEIVEHHDLFVGSEATDYGNHLDNLHKFTDEL